MTAHFARRVAGFDHRTPGLFMVAVVAALALVTSTSPGHSAELHGGARPEVVDAIDRGIEYLRGLQHEDGRWPRADVGATALAALALLECDCPVGDPAVQKAAAAVRLALPDLADTYSIALAILFLDRLGEASDVPLIQALSVRLLAGQTTSGGWSYTCPLVDDAEPARLTTLLTQRPAVAKPRDDTTRLEMAPEVRTLYEKARKRLQLASAAVGVAGLGAGDNSNTQFAILGLWTARRHGVPVHETLLRVARHFRDSQNRDGGWGYISVFSPGGGRGSSTASMTCAGLLGFAVGVGALHEARLRAVTAAESNKEAKPDGTVDPPRPAPKQPVLDIRKDPAIIAGLIALGTTVDQPTGRMLPRSSPGALRQGYYFLWGLERVAVAYDLRTIGNKDWYAWGAELLVASQFEDGSWKGEYPDGVDTCFALLFLRRANLAADLSATLKGRLGDPGSVQLKAGGIGGAELHAGKGLNPGIALGAAKAAATVQPVSGTTAVDEDTRAARRLTDDLLLAAAERQAKLLEEYQRAKGASYTLALASAIPRLEEIPRGKAREVLALRLARMTAATLRDKLHDDDAEIRRAAALACVVKEDRSSVGDLIDLLEDGELSVRRAAHVALKQLTSQDFGPEKDATAGERKRAAAAWRDWWRTQKP